jgi:hypothetical protein
MAPWEDCTETSTVPFFGGVVVGGTLALFAAVPLFFQSHG